MSSDVIAQLTTKELSEIMFSAAAVVGAVLAAVGAIIGFFLKRYWDARDQEYAAKDIDRLKYRDILFDSLKWFEGGTQKRSIGIAVVNASWDSFESFRPIWIEVFVNQAIYLLRVSKEGERAHEHHNLHRIMDLLVSKNDCVATESKKLLGDTLKEKLDGNITKGLTLTDELEEKIKKWSANYPPPLR